MSSTGSSSAFRTACPRRDQGDHLGIAPHGRETVRPLEPQQVDLVGRVHVARVVAGAVGQRPQDPVEGAAVPVEDRPDQALVTVQGLSLAGVEVEEGQVERRRPHPRLGGRKFT
jgi:hypothetical protein